MFSVVIPIHNKFKYLNRSVISVLNQKFADFELLLIDDASTDGSAEKISTYKDPRIRVLKRDVPGPGGYAARNLGIRQAQYNWIAFLDADDEWKPDYLEEIYRAQRAFPEAELIAADWEIKNEEGVVDNSLQHKNPYTSFSLLQYLKETRYIWTGAVSVKKALIERDQSIGFPAQDKACKRGGDIDTWIRWLYNSKENLHINKTLARYYMDVEGQVTQIPNTHFCAYQTLKQILKETDDTRQQEAIKRFSNRFIYNMLARQVRSGMPLDYKEIKKMYPNSYSILRILKLHWLRVKSTLNPQEEQGNSRLLK